MNDWAAFVMTLSVTLLIGRVPVRALRAHPDRSDRFRVGFRGSHCTLAAEQKCISKGPVGAAMGQRVRHSLSGTGLLATG